MGAKGVWKYEESALLLIDYQKEMFDQIRSETPAELIDLNVRLLIKAAEAFNMPNHVNPNNPNVTLTDPNFGKILSTNDGRTMQMALKYVF